MSESDAPDGTADSELELDHRVALRTGRERYRTDVMVRGHPLVVDEPPRLGGGDQGPTPIDLLCAALGSCTTITLRMYADRKGWALEEVLLRVEHQRSGRAAAERSEERDRFTMSLTLRGDLDEAQRARLVEIAGRCPVHRILARGSEVVVESVLA